MSRIRNLRRRAAAVGWWRTLAYALLGVGMERCGVEFLDVFESVGAVEPPPPRVAIRTGMVDAMALLSSGDLNALRRVGGERLVRGFEAAFALGDRCIVARVDGEQLACVCWLAELKNYVPAGGFACTRVERCFTWPEQRGLGIFPQTLRQARAYVRSRADMPQSLYIESSVFNTASIRAVTRAGFKKRGRLVRFWGKSLYSRTLL
ncbi:MAG: hypothetical protein JXR37_12450 [Kiritimatiellae bacterium]|nr:hypothetical protein [Kiritimatiellia bacterium]